MVSGMNLGLFSLELAYGILVSMVNIAIQAVVSVSLIRLLRGMQRRTVKRHRVLALAGAMMATGALLTFSHMMQVWIWARAYDLVGIVKTEDAYYFAFVNFTTLGYGDIVGQRPWRLLGPITAANGMLLFGMSTALIFAVMTRAATVLHVFDTAPHRKPLHRHKEKAEAETPAPAAPSGP